VARLIKANLGSRLAQNGSGGLDHGHGNAVLGVVEAI
jgi:hypothetical protein